MEEPVKTRRGLMLIAAGIVWLSAFALMAQSTIDFRDDFDSVYTNNQPVGGVNNWGADSSNIQVKAGLGYSATRGVEMPLDCTLSNLFSGSSNTNVWSDFFVRPALYVPASTNMPNPTLDTNASAMFYFNSNGYLVVADLPAPGTTNWVQLTDSISGAPVSPIAESAWTRVSVYHRYAQSNFSVFVNGLLLRERMTNVNKSVGTFTKFQVYNGGGITAYVDQVNIMTSAPPADLSSDYDLDDMRDAWEIHYFGDTTGSHTAGADPDGDGFTNAEESSGNSDPNDSLSMPATVGLPYYEPFDSRTTGSVHGVNGWTALGSYMNITADETFNSSAKALGLGYGEALLTNIVNSVTYTSVWSDFVIKPGLMYWDSATGSVKATTTAAFFVDTNGWVSALDGTTWMSLTNYLGGVTTNAQPVAIQTSLWARFVVHNDYVNQKWSLWVSTNALADTNALMRQVGSGLDFANSATRYGGLTFTNFNSANYSGYVDNVSITLTMPAFLDSDGDGIPDVYETEYSLTGPTNNMKDTDGDGMTDLQEYISGTDPNNSNSFLRILSLDLPAEGSSDVRLVFDPADDATIVVLGSANPRGQRNAVGSFYTGPYGQTNTFVHSGGATNPWFFYQVMSTRNGSGVTNVEEFVGHMQPRNFSNRFYFVSVPIAGMTNLGTELGSHLQRGLAVGDSAFVLKSNIWDQFDLNASREWRVGGGGPVVTDFEVPVGTGIRLWQRGAPTATTRANFFGRRFTNASVNVTIPPGWTFRAWPYDTTTNYPSGTNLIGFAATAGGTGTNNSDFIWAYRQDGALINLRLDVSGRWYYYGGVGGIGEANGVHLNGGFWYFNHLGTDTLWVPQRPQ